MKNQYPSKEQILEYSIQVLPKTVNVLKKWKTKDWIKNKKLDPIKKYQSLSRLAFNICIMHGVVAPRMSYKPSAASSFYYAGEKTIVLDASLSIITLLHELAHHLFGDDELNACAWSVQHFTKAFPKAYGNLVWEGHMLKRSKESQKAL